MDNSRSSRYAFWTVVALLIGALPAHADSSGSLAMTMTVQPSISISVDSPAETRQNGSSVMVLLRIDADGTPSRGFTRERMKAGWRYATPVAITIHQANLASASYSVIARLSHAADAGTSWSVNGQRLTEASSTMAAVGAAYDTPQQFDCSMSVSDAVAPHTIENDFVLTVVTN